MSQLPRRRRRQESRGSGRTPPKPPRYAAQLALRLWQLRLRIVQSPCRLRTMFRSAVQALAITLALFATACGSSTPAAKPAPPTTRDESPSEANDSAQRDVKPPNCTDGTCFRCGQGICLPGFYCDESTANANCQWLAPCAKNPNCGCLQASLGSGCTCSERNGGLFVKCNA